MRFINGSVGQKITTIRQKHTLDYIIFGCHYLKQYRPLIEKQAYDFNADPALVRLSLQILCTFWEPLEEYGQLILDLLEHENSTISSMAVSCAGCYLRCYDNKEILERLLFIVMDETEETGNRQWGYRSLCLAIGQTEREIEILIRRYFSDKVNLANDSVIEAVKYRLEQH